MVLYFNILYNIIYFCHADFSASLLQSSVLIYLIAYVDLLSMLKTIFFYNLLSSTIEKKILRRTSISNLDYKSAY